MKKSQYNQKLTPEKAAEGINAIKSNAHSLIDDAELLYKHGRYERATALSILAVEEAGKVSIIRSILMEDDQKELNKEWKRFRNHLDKNWGLAFFEAVQKGNNHFDELKYLLSDEKSKKSFEYLKQLAFYTEYFKNKNWSTPDKIIDKDLATSILRSAKVFVGGKKSSVSTKEELELWVKHLKPVWKKNNTLMKQAVINFYKEAEENGILSSKANAIHAIDFLL
ncbi:AbiV family abortive infection protein [Gracilimonas sp. Q87]|uniref:AbiV family abortive infection protein n=1 Tax=Gracilimonas sp. Q87 TaxID=3384766 RepID=UPI0039844731